MAMERESAARRHLKGLPPRPTVKVVAAVPEPSGWLPERAREIWETVTPELERIGVLGRVDVALLEQFAVTYAAWRDAECRPSRNSLGVRSRNSLVRSAVLV